MTADRQTIDSECVVPTMVQLRERLETIRSGEINRARTRLRPLNAEQEMAIESLTRSIIDEILDGVVAALTATSVDEDRVAAIEIVHRIFDLDRKYVRAIRAPLMSQLSVREVAR
jgi:glutamyl-tRNA reductase